MSVQVMIDGQLRAPGDAKVSVFDRGFLYGDSVFETIRTYHSLPFALSEHLARLEASASKVFIELPVPVSQLAEEVRQTLAAAANPESYIRVMITRGQGALGLDPALANVASRVIIVEQLKALPPSAYRDGVATVTFKTLRPSDATAAEGAKIGNYLVAVLAMREAKAEGAHEALILDAQGHVVEGATSNLFYVVAGRLLTPPVRAGILPGITRDRILKAAQRLGIETEFALPNVEQLQAADEVLISSSIRELVPVVRVDGVPVGDARPGPITTQLHAEFRRLVETELQLQ